MTEVRPEDYVLLRRPIMGFLATGHTREGDVIGPLEPVSIEMKPSPGGFVLELTFQAVNETDHRYTIDDVTIHVADTIRRITIGERLWPHDHLGLNYRMTGTFDDLKAPPTWPKRRGWIRR